MEDSGRSIREKLAALGWTLPAPPKPIAAYVPAVRSGNLLFVSGQLPLIDGMLIATGKITSVISVELAKKCAAQCAVNALAIVDGEIGGDWSQFVRIIRIGVFVQSDSDFAFQSTVANGASELLQQLFGEAGRHARAAVGCNALPLNAPVEVEMTVELR